MEKILLVLHAHKPNTASIGFACRVAEFAETKLTGLIIDHHISERSFPDETGKRSYYESFPASNLAEVSADTDQTVRIFMDECERRGVEGEVYMPEEDPVQQVIFESRFADLLIIDPHLTLDADDEMVPSFFLKEVLSHSECAILLSPRDFEEIDEIVFCYDGHASSVFAIKQFTYLLPGCAAKKALLLEINDKRRKEFNESDRRMMEWLRAHYHNAYYHFISGDVEDSLLTYLFMKRKKMVVMGAYGRNVLSLLLKKSNADILVRSVDLPLFITHP